MHKERLPKEKISVGGTQLPSNFQLNEKEYFTFKPSLL
jgi:hypothetical protein